MKKILLFVFISVLVIQVSQSFSQGLSSVHQSGHGTEGIWLYITAFSWGVIWPMAEGYIHGLTFTRENPLGYPLGLRVDDGNKHLLYGVNRVAAISGAISLALWHPPVKYFFTWRGAARTVGVWCVWSSLFNATIRKVQTDEYFPKSRHQYYLKLGSGKMNFQESPAWVRKAQLGLGVLLYFSPDIFDLFRRKKETARSEQLSEMSKNKNSTISFFPVYTGEGEAGVNMRIFF